MGCESGAIKVWDIASGLPAAILDLEGHSEDVDQIRASDSSSQVLSCSRDKTLRLWDLRTGRCVRIMEGHTSYVYSVDMDSVCRTAVSGSEDTTVKVWDLGSGRCMETYEGHEQHVSSVFMHESGGAFISQSRDRIMAWADGAPSRVMEVEMEALGKPECWCMYANRDLSQVAAYFHEEGESTSDIYVWK